VVCGPTASGKSELSDALAEELGIGTPTLVVDSMQVYREIPAITNQARRRPAELVGIVSVTEEWTVARHKKRAEEIIEPLDSAFVLDAGTGMYLNAIILDVPIAPKVDEQTRRIAQEFAAAAPNPRRVSRAKELELAGAPQRGSIWEGDLRYDTTTIYLRPNRAQLDAAIARRSQVIARDGLEEAAEIQALASSGAKISASVTDSIGVRELLHHLQGKLTLEEAEAQITARTRSLARRQTRWFDKLARTLHGRIEIVERNPGVTTVLNCMHDKIRT
jgi:tRNA dimethylallyltransferase